MKKELKGLALFVAFIAVVSGAYMVFAPVAQAYEREQTSIGELTIGGPFLVDNISYNTGGLPINLSMDQFGKLTQDGIAVTEKIGVDMSATSASTTVSLITIPIDSVLLDVSVVIEISADGTAQTFEVGVDGNTDAYIDPSDFNPGGSVGDYMSIAGGTNQDVKGPQPLIGDATSRTLIATWTNTVDATAGQVSVFITYLDMR